MKKIIAKLMKRNGLELAGYAVILAGFVIAISALFRETEELAAAIIMAALFVAYGGVCLAEKGAYKRALAEAKQEERRARIAAKEAEKQNEAVRKQIMELLTKMPDSEEPKSAKKELGDTDAAAKGEA